MFVKPDPSLAFPMNKGSRIEFHLMILTYKLICTEAYIT